MMHLRINLFKMLSLTTLLTFIVVGAFGLSLSMQTDEMGNMSNCPLMSSSASLCQIDVTQHISHWQQLFTATVQSSTLLLLIAPLAACTAFALCRHYINVDQPDVSCYRKRMRDNPQMKVLDHLLLSLSNGILQPKLYA